MSLGDRLVVMKDGVIQQVGTPEEIYDSPTNQFVASFVGTPPMNFISQTEFAEPEEVLGLRPDAISPNPDGQIEAKLVLLENLGDCSDLYLDFGDQRLICRVPGRCELNEGETYRFALDLTRALIFAA